MWFPDHLNSLRILSQIQSAKNEANCESLTEMSLRLFSFQLLATDGML